MNLEQEMELYRRGYEQSVKSWIEKGEYGLAYFELGKINFILENNPQEIALNIHMGMSLIASAESLKQKLQEGNKENIQHDLKFFEAFLAQTKLPMDISTI